MSDFKLHLGDCLQVMATMEPDSVDAICCDPPYMIGFMGKAFDKSKDNIAGRVEVWAECLRVAKPGAHLLAFGADRTHHRLMVAIEDAGWEIRTCLYWIFGSGFPKSMDIGKQLDRMAGAEREVIGITRTGIVHGKAFESIDESDKWQPVTAPSTDAAKQWHGWGTALKPAAEIIVMARKPLSEPNIAANALRWGTGALNIDGCRIGTDERTFLSKGIKPGSHNIVGSGWDGNNGEKTVQGRWPANVAFDEDAARLLDEQSGERKSGGGQKSKAGKAINGQWREWEQREDTHRYAKDYFSEPSTGGASRFFLRVQPDAEDEPLRFLYCAKASRKDRNEGLEGMEEKSPWTSFDGQYAQSRNPTTGERLGEYKREQSNHHPCVKPTALCRYLVRLVTPPNGTVLDPFMGSGSTLKAAILEGFDCIGIELDPEYLAIAQARCDHARAQMQLPLLEAAGGNNAQRHG